MEGDGDFNQQERLPPRVVTVPRGLFARTRRAGGLSSRRRPVDELLNIAEAGADSLTCFKVVQPLGKTIDNRPVPGHCIFCYPNLQRQVGAAWSSMGVRNCFCLQSKPSWISPDLCNFWSKRKLAEKFHIVTAEDVVQSPALEKEFNRLATKIEMNTKFQEVKAQLREFVETFGFGKVSERMLQLLISLGGWLISVVLRRLFDGVCVHEGQIELLKSYSRNQPVIYVPVQRSHWDHFILSWTLLQWDLKTPFSFIRESMFKSRWLTKLAKLAGGLGWPSTEKTSTIESEFPVKGLALELYVRCLMKNRQSLEVAVESHRSRNGNPGTTFVGTEFLGLASKFVEEGVIEDAIVVPVSVNYEKFPEPGIIANYDRKTPPSLWKSLWTILRRNFGFVRLSFGHPVSVREFKSTALNPMKMDDLLKRTEKNEYFWITDGYCNPMESNNLNWDDDTQSVTSVNSLYGNTGVVSTMNKSAVLVADMLTYHVLYDAWKSSVFMSTNLLAFLLLTDYRKKSPLIEEVEGDMAELICSVRTKKADVGFTASNLQPVIRRAVRLLSPVVSLKKTKDGHRLTMSSQRSDLVYLSYYSNPLVSFLIMEGIIAAAMFALRGRKLSILNGAQAYVTVYERELIEKATQLSLLLKGQFLLHPPCIQLEEAIKITIDKMRDEYLISYETVKTNRDEDDDEMWVEGDSERVQLKGVEDPLVYNKLLRARNLVMPYVEAYGAVFPVFYELLPSEENPTNDMREGDLRSKMLDKLVSSSHVPPEIAVIDTVKNFILSLKHLGIIGHDLDSDGKIVYYVCEDYASEAKLDVALNNILSFYSA